MEISHNGIENNDFLNSWIFDDWTDIDSIKNTNETNHHTKINFNDSSTSLNTTSNLDISALCCDEELIGFDKNTGSSWIYPTNYPVRDYQYNIVKAALFKNTLVSLPTGLGKTFIAAVVMFNYYRWYPLGKIIFTAPTRPLVAQQIEACYNIMAIPPEHTIEMTGSMPTATRKIAWQKKRVFFATPQVVQNDLESGSCPGELIRCLVVDEAHRARGRHSYCQLIESLALQHHRLFRVLALSATPGSKVEDVIHVVRSLQISHLELRSEGCIDVAMYSHSRSIQTIVVELGDELTNIRDQYIQILDVYTRRLVQHKVLVGNIGGLSKGRVIMLFKEFQTREKSLRHPQHKYIMHDFTMVITLYHGLELLTKHGARVFLNFFDERTDKEWIGKDTQLLSFLERLRDDLGTNPFSLNTSMLPDGTFPEITEELKYGHPKFDHLKKTITEHFNSAKAKGQVTKAIVFCEYRESVNLVHCLLLQCRPMIKPYMFVGQGQAPSGGSKQTSKPFTQKQQLRVMQLFREGSCNVLVSTCVGEEGLDVGNVDLIICFDISNKSPIRLVQRCGRTGRERGGRVVILVTEGREHQTLRDCITQRDSLNKRVLQSKELGKNLFKACPRMFPSNVIPVCQKMFITVEQKKIIEKTQKPQKGQSKIRDMLVRKSSFDDNFQSNQETSASSSHLTKSEFLTMYPGGMPDFKFFNSVSECWNMSKGAFSKHAVSDSKSSVVLSEWTEWQRKLQYTVKINHSKDSEIFSELLQFADQKRFDIPTSTQTSSIPLQSVPSVPISKSISRASPAKKKGKISHQNTIKKKNFDIRDLFMKQTQSNNKEETVFKSKLKETLEDCGINDEDKETLDKILQKDHIPSSLIDLMVELNIQKCITVKSTASKFSFDFCDESIFKSECYIKENNKIISILSDWNTPDNLSLNNISFEDMDFQSYITQDSPSILKELDLIIPNATVVQVFKNKSLDSGLKSANTSKDTVLKIPDEQNYEIDLGGIDDIFADSPISEIESSPVKKDSNVMSPTSVHVKSFTDCNSKHENRRISGVSLNASNEFDFADIDEIFNESPVPERPNNCFTKGISQNKTDDESNINKLTKSKSALDFFGLESVEDMFVDENSTDEFNDGSPTQIFIESSEKIGENLQSAPSSPILCSQKSKNLSYLKSVKSFVERRASTPIHSKSTLNQKSINGVIDITGDSKNKQNHFNVSDVFDHSYDQDMINLKNRNHITVNNNRVLNHQVTKNVCKNDDSSFLSVTQIINLIDKSGIRDDEKGYTQRNGLSKKTENNIIFDDSDDSNKSIILCSQVVKKKKPLKKDTVRNGKLSITILETTSESSTGDDDDVFISSNKTFANKKCRQRNISPLKINIRNCENSFAVKRKISPASSAECSPFFNKIPKLDDIKTKISPKNKLSLKEKLNLGRTRKTASPLKVLNNDRVEDTFSSRLNFVQNKRESDCNSTAPSQIPSLMSRLQSFSKDSSPGWLRKRNLSNQNNDRPPSANYSKKKSSESDSDSDFADKSFSKRNLSKTVAQKVRVKKKRRKKPVSEFIDYEAILSDDSYERTSGEYENGSENSNGADTSMIEFLCDEEHLEADDSIDMEAKYLQSVKSPVKSGGKFKIPQLPKFTTTVYSQIDPDENHSYELDSFCVDIDQGLTQRHDMSELERAEAILRKKKTRRKPKKVKYTSPPRVSESINPADDSPIRMKKKKRPNIHIDSESSTDDDIFN